MNGEKLHKVNKKNDSSKDILEIIDFKKLGFIESLKMIYHIIRLRFISDEKKAKEIKELRAELEKF